MIGNQNLSKMLSSHAPDNDASERLWLLSPKQPEPRMCSLNIPGLGITWESAVSYPLNQWASQVCISNQLPGVANAANL